jgi:sulfur-oxidizing protein SoxZ
MATARRGGGGAGRLHRVRLDAHPNAVARTLISKPESAKPGEVVEVRATIAHPMETGLRLDATGVAVPRLILRSFVCHEREQLVFASTFSTAVAANPSVRFFVRMGDAPLTLTLRWVGDAGFDQREFVTVNVGG